MSYPLFNKLDCTDPKVRLSFYETALEILNRGVLHVEGFCFLMCIAGICEASDKPISSLEAVDIYQKYYVEREGYFPYPYEEMDQYPELYAYKPEGNGPWWFPSYDVTIRKNILSEIVEKMKSEA